MTSIVEIEGLRKVYPRSRGGDVIAVSNLDLQFGDPGTVHGFLGPNGSGKTTTIRCLLRLIRPTAGSTRLFGVDTASGLHTVASRIGAIVEGPKLFGPFSGYRNLSLLAAMEGVPAARVHEVLDIVGLSGRGGDSFDSYSLGMKQRLAIGAALLKDPDLLILDEPANGLDPAGIAEMRRLISSIAAQGKAVLVSSHQLSEIEQICTEVTIINRGELVITGALDEVRRHGGSDGVVITSHDRDHAIGLLREAGIEARPRPEVDEAVVMEAPMGAAAINQFLAQRGHFLRGIRVERATLESAFLNLTGGPPPPMTPPSGPPTGPPTIPPTIVEGTQS